MYGFEIRLLYQTSHVQTKKSIPFENAFIICVGNFNDDDVHLARVRGHAPTLV